MWYVVCGMWYVVMVCCGVLWYVVDGGRWWGGVVGW